MLLKSILVLPILGEKIPADTVTRDPRTGVKLRLPRPYRHPLFLNRSHFRHLITSVTAANFITRVSAVGDRY